MKISNLHFSFGDNIIFQGLELDIPNGQITALMGPSGKGKTTLLRLIAGLIQPGSGSIDVGNRSVGIMFQEPRLFPQLNVLQNVMLVIDNKHEKKERALALLKSFDVLDAVNKYPEELSGGMAKRVALARAIAYNTDILLLDEPFSALDSNTKDQVIAQTKQLVRNKTVIIVTHDQAEAELFADQILTLS